MHHIALKEATMLKKGSKDKYIAMIGNTSSCHKNKKLGPAIQKLQDKDYYTVQILSLQTLR